MPKKCPNCKTDNTIASHYCRNCGYEFTADDKNSVSTNSGSGAGVSTKEAMTVIGVLGVIATLVLFFCGVIENKTLAVAIAMGFAATGGFLGNRT